MKLKFSKLTVASRSKYLYLGLKMLTLQNGRESGGKGYRICA